MSNGTLNNKSKPSSKYRVGIKLGGTKTEIIFEKKKNMFFILNVD